MEVVKAANGAPGFALTGVAFREVAARGARVLLALTHDAGVAAATVVLDHL
jgi:holo-[acyl-carrier protein] synthase